MRPRILSAQFLQWDWEWGQGYTVPNTKFHPQEKSFYKYILTNRQQKILISAYICNKTYQIFYRRRGAIQGGTRLIFWDETETEKLDLWKFTTKLRPKKVDADFWTRQDRDETVSFFHGQDETETRLNLKFGARPRQGSPCLFLQDRGFKN